MKKINLPYDVCVLLGQKYHFALLTKLEKEVKNPSESQIKKTFEQLEEMVKNLFHSIVKKDIIDFLQSLPSLEEWDKDLVYKQIKNSSFIKL